MRGRSKIILILVIIGTVAFVGAGLFRLVGNNAGSAMVEETRQSLRKQGFKADLSGFDFSTSPELRAREAILTATVFNRNSLLYQFVKYPDLMEPMGTNSAVNSQKAQIDKACDARLWREVFSDRKGTRVLSFHCFCSSKRGHHLAAAGIEDGGGSHADRGSKGTSANNG